MVPNHAPKCVSRPFQQKATQFDHQLLILVLAVFALLLIRGVPTAFAQDGYVTQTSQSTSLSNSSDSAGSSSSSASAQAYPEPNQSSADELAPTYPGEPMNKPPLEAKIG